MPPPIDARLCRATPVDIPALVDLLDMAYRGDRSRVGWTTEADLIDGEVRTTPKDVREVMQAPGSVFLICREAGEDEGAIIACVNLKIEGSRLYLGMFAVRPALQGNGIGRAMLQAAEGHARAHGCGAIYMHVISQRPAIIAWYKRRGYVETGEVVPFPEDFSGRHLRPLEFLVLEKRLGSPTEPC